MAPSCSCQGQLLQLQCHSKVMQGKMCMCCRWRYACCCQIRNNVAIYLARCQHTCFFLGWGWGVLCMKARYSGTMEGLKAYWKYSITRCCCPFDCSHCLWMNHLRKGNGDHGHSMLCPAIVVKSPTLAAFHAIECMRCSEPIMLQERYRGRRSFCHKEQWQMRPASQAK